MMRPTNFSDGITELKKSYEWCLCQPGFFAFFHKTLLASNPYASSFLGEQPNEQSHQILKTGLSTLMLKLQGAKAGDTLMGRAKAKHRAYHDAFPPSLLDSWLESFLTAAARFDPKFTPEMEAIWRSSLSPILDEMKHSLSSFNK